ncbi:MAG: hypothetical protein ABJ013_10405 [Halioglobus sp.]
MSAFTTIAHRTLLALCFAGLLASNALMLTSTAFNTAVSGILAGTLGIRTASSALQSRISSQNTTIKRQSAEVAQRKAAAKRFGNRLASRTKRVAVKSIAAIPAESIPFVGIAVLIADTGYELYAACETLNELDKLYDELGITQTTSEDTLKSVCNPELPDAQHIWEGIMHNSSGWWDAMQSSM